MGLVFLTVFLDMVGFSVIFPLFPQMLDWYVAEEGPESFVGRLAAWLETLVEDRFAVIVLFGGLLGSLYSGLQFIFAPIWGGLSDRRGRRSILLFTLTGTALSYVVWFFAGSFALLIAARLTGGIMAGNISIASAAVADTHKKADRAKGMGILGAGIGLGFVVGPALGGLASGWDLTASLPDTPGVNPFSGAALIAFGLALLNLEGTGMVGVPGIAARTFAAVASQGASVLMISQASSEQSICFVIPTPAAPPVIRAVEDELALELAPAPAPAPG